MLEKETPHTASAVGPLFDFDPTVNEALSNSGGPFILNTHPGTEISAVLGPYLVFDTSASARKRAFYYQEQFTGVPVMGELHLGSTLKEPSEFRPIIQSKKERAKSFERVLEQGIVHYAVSAAFIASFLGSWSLLTASVAHEIQHYLAAYLKSEAVSPKNLTSIAKTQASRLESFFHFKDRDAVIGFLQENPLLVDTLLETRQKIDHYFGLETRSALEVFTDPEDDEHCKLFALILTQLPSSEASRHLNEMDEGWWFTQPYEVKRLMNIDVEYIDGSV